MSRPNLLFLFTDEQRYDTLGAYGNDLIQTPNLDRLADESVVFEKAYVSQPVCTPSRSTLMTGQWPHANGCFSNNIPLPVDVPAFAELLREGEYRTGYHGKWHLGDEVFRQHGFEEWVATEDGYHYFFSPDRDSDARSDYSRHLREIGFTPRNGERFHRDQVTRLPEPYGKPSFLARESSRFIRENHDQPWCLFVNFLEPHMPFFGPRDGQYDPADMPLPENFDAVPTEDQPEAVREMYRKYLEKGFEIYPLASEMDWKHLVANYWGLCSLVDTHAGAILDALRESGQWDNTIIVYTSDHGDMMGSHRILGKGTMFEEACLVPMMIRTPGQGAQRRVSGRVSQVDMVPTLLDLMGQDIVENLPGRSLRPEIEGAEPDREVFIEWDEPLGTHADYAEAVAAKPDPSQSIRTVITQDGWKLNWNATGEHELYNLTDDPGERTNLFGDPSRKDRIEDLAWRIGAWQERTGDTAELPAIR